MVLHRQEDPVLRQPRHHPRLVQPGFTHSDPHWQTDWTFCEFTYNSANLYANISYVDLVALPVSMATTGSGGNQSVSPLPSGALAGIAAGLRAQHAADGAPWDQLVATDSSGNVLRVMAPTHSPTTSAATGTPTSTRCGATTRPPP